MNTQHIRIESTAHDALPRLSSASTAAVAAGKCLIWRAMAEFICCRALRAAEAELMALDDRMLMGIGLKRGEIKSVSRIAPEAPFRYRPLDRLPHANAAAELGKWSELTGRVTRPRD